MNVTKCFTQKKDRNAQNELKRHTTVIENLKDKFPQAFYVDWVNGG